ncbi:MAG: GNAT family N-acetyltransferase [Pyrinomonadaceae bacterium]
MLGEAITADQIFIPCIPPGSSFLASMSYEASAIATVTMGFSTDPVARWFYPEPADYFRWFPKFVRAFAGKSIEHGTAFCTANYSGAALWLKPGVHPNEDAMVELVLESIPQSRQSAVFELFEKMDGGHPNEPHWYLPMIGVDTFEQNKGIGSSLMRAALAQCDGEGLPAYLESSNPRNISLYRRLGFKAIGEIRVGDIPPLIPMLREAQR